MNEGDKRYEQELYKTLSYSNEQFDKNVLFIASGALAISFAFVEKLVPNLEIAKQKDYLIDAWYFFGCVIFISLICHFISILSIRWSITNHQKKDFEKGMYRWNLATRILNFTMIIGLLIGIILLINFIKQNI